MTKEIDPVAWMHPSQLLAGTVGIMVSSAQFGSEQVPLYGPEAMERIRELEARLEINPHTNVDGIAARDETIRMLEAENAELRRSVYAWLGTWRDKLPAESVTELQTIVEKASA